MTRLVWTAMAIGVGIGILAGQGCGSVTGVGDPCTPEEELKTDFLGFDRNQVYTESKSFQCQTRLCLVDHFQGRTNCPYGQDRDGVPPESGGECKTPQTGKLVVGTSGDAINGKTVRAQCSNRRTAQAVYCSCRCANIEGKTDDGANYCKCPDGFSCQQLVTSIGPADTGLTGGYCVREGAAYDPNQPCTACDPVNNKCE